MLQYLLGVALICMGALTIYARVMARSVDLHQPVEERVHPSPVRRRKR